MNKLATYIENNGIEKTAGILDKLFKRNPVTNPILEKLKRIQKIQEKTVNDTFAKTMAPPDLNTSFGTNINISEALGSRYSKVDQLSETARQNKTSPWFSYFGKQHKPYTLFQKAMDESLKKNSYKQIGFDLKRTKKVDKTLGIDLTYTSHIPEVKSKSGNLKTLLERQAEMEIIATLDKHHGLPIAQEIKAAILKPTTTWDQHTRRTILKNVLNSRAEGKAFELKLSDPTTKKTFYTKVDLPFEASDRGVHFDMNHMFGKDSKGLFNSLNSKYETLVTQSKKVNEDLDTAYDQVSKLKQQGKSTTAAERKVRKFILESEKLETDMSNVSKFRVKFAKTLKNKGPIAYKDITTEADLLLLLDSPFMRHTLPTGHRQTILDGIAAAGKKYKTTDTGESLKYYLNDIAQTGNHTNDIHQIFRHQRMSSERTKQMHEDIATAAKSPYDEIGRLAMDAGATGALGAGAVAMPYFFYKGYKKRSKEQNKTPV